MKKFIALALIAATVSACATKEERFASHAFDCEQYGFTAGTQGYAQCMMQAENGYQARQAQTGAALIASGAIIQAANTPQTYNVNHSGSIYGY